ncbi:GGDEF domain-containing protein [Moritella sp. Urea-trap-13]|uniref:GGDEF domain-containing protein n=1 Tax=Moritella sp. Urea-trap-13 TaxID=2058327 RepID=UPI000C34BEA2|nr:GGDEF domain-containing protein [Moritella sp. Urea-trap-13]PKH07555.1 GGDEF domain-containing protein [Moritella sp. Urea-trap-13]
MLHSIYFAVRMFIVSFVVLTVMFHYIFSASTLEDEQSAIHQTMNDLSDALLELSNIIVIAENEELASSTSLNKRSYIYMSKAEVEPETSTDAGTVDLLSQYKNALDRLGFITTSSISGNFMIKDWQAHSVLYRRKLEPSVVSTIFDSTRCRELNICKTKVNKYRVSYMHEDALSGNKLFTIFKGVNEHIDIGFNVHLNSNSYYDDKNISIMPPNTKKNQKNYVISVKYADYPDSLLFYRSEYADIADGIIVIVQIPFLYVLDIPLKFSGILSFFIAISIFYFHFIQRITCESELHKEKSMIDTLTKAYNRRYFDYYSEATSSGVLAVIDGNKIKEINDTLGHSAGDSAIKLLASSAQEIIRDEDYLIRSGGDEFVILLNDCPTIEIATEIIEKIQNRIIQKSKYKKEFREHKISFAYGLTPYSEGDLYDEIIEMADFYMYENKNK